MRTLKKKEETQDYLEGWRMRFGRKIIEIEVHDIRDEKKNHLLVVLNNMKGYYHKDGYQLFAICYLTRKVGAYSIEWVEVR